MRVLCSCWKVHARVAFCVTTNRFLRGHKHTHLHVLYKFTRRYFCTHTEAVSSCSYCTLITCKHQGYVHVVGTCVVIWWHWAPRYPGQWWGASLWCEPQDGGSFTVAGDSTLQERSLFLNLSLFGFIDSLLFHFLLSDSASKQDTTAQITVLLHCHCQYNNNNDSHQVRLHCHHQIWHTRELKLKSYTIISHIISNQISTTETNDRKNKLDKNDQCWLNTSTILQKCKCWFCFRLFVLFSSRALAWKETVSCHCSSLWWWI